MFKINKISWQIKFVQPSDSIFNMSNGEKTVGVCDNDLKVIFLSTSLRGNKLKHVLCHEIVHAAMFSYNVVLEYEQEELLANIIATHGQEIVDIANDIFKRLHI